MVRASVLIPEVSSGELYNPERGFYSLYKYEVKDEEEDTESLVKSIYNEGNDHLLEVEICLSSWLKGDISYAGMKNLENFFSALKTRKGSYIIRFLYDLEGRSRFSEPEELDTIFRHMEQTGTIVRRFENMIFLIQGFFTGDWGEMHGSEYSKPEYLPKLFFKMRESFGPDIYLAVRTPAQWRFIRAQDDKRTGLFNDGIMGSISDLGSYGKWGDDLSAVREEELRFQERICRTVPNGGEVVSNPMFDDFDLTLKTLKKMHISYLNRHHDQRRISEWKKHRLNMPGPWAGVDGFTYIGRHLGYRYEISDVQIMHKQVCGILTVIVKLDNAGFAPCYHRLDAIITVVQNEKTIKYSFGFKDGSPVEGKIPVKELRKGMQLIYFSLFSRKYNCPVYLGNKEVSDYGYLIGRIDII